MNEEELKELSFWTGIEDLTIEEAESARKLRDFCDKPFTREDLIRFIDNELFNSVKKFSVLLLDDGSDKFRMERCYIRFLTTLKGTCSYPEQVKKAVKNAIKNK